ncbi:MAG: helix-turn-helix domain-containing protein [Flavobacteriaceae bacterium]|nr:helix-turn-helix domain-containing protein [Flavobacteriaceae bacterium]
MLESGDNTLIKFGDNLRKLRVAQSISQQQLAFESGLSREYINRIENGNVNISLKNIVAIANVLNIAVKDFFFNF